MNREKNYPYYVKIIWGEYPDSVEDDAFEEYAFETKPELTAFIWGIEESSGWNDCGIVDPQNILNYPQAYGSEGDYRREQDREDEVNNEDES